MDHVFVYLVVILIGSTGFIINIATIFVLLMNKKLRKLTTNLPILSFLLASAIQGLIAAPIYVYKKLEHVEHLSGWVCDTYRVPYFFCGHIVKWSLLLVSIDRLLAIKYPFKHAKYISRHNMTLAICIFWLITVGIDMLPFFLVNSKIENCHYIPTRTWGLSVIILYNIIPFGFIVVNYLLIWNVAAKLALTDKQRRDTFNRSRNLPDKNDDKQLVKSNVRFILEMKATKTSFVFIAVYVLCWGPLGVFYMIDHFCYNCLSHRNDLIITRAAIKILCFSSSFLAPLAYCWRSHDFRKAAWKIYIKRCVGNKKRFKSSGKHQSVHRLINRT